MDTAEAAVRTWQCWVCPYISAAER